jgi:hypothetical protein
MSDETKTAAPSDEQLGAALRKIAEANGQTPAAFAFYAATFVRWSSDDAWILRISRRQRVRRVKVIVHPADDRFDGVFEHIVEMIAGDNVPVSAVGNPDD